MKVEVNFKGIIVEVICLLYVVLFVYAAGSKLIDFQNFQVQLGQSPLLSAFASWVSWCVLISELLIAALLCFGKTRLFGLYAALGLMVMFSIYIIIILKFSPFVPCSCGGVLEKLTWSQHLIFNIVYCIIAIAAIIFQSNENLGKNRLSSAIINVLILTACSTVIMIALFQTSENMMHHQNNFTRRFPHHLVNLSKIIDLKFNSYYIAGEGNGKIYLGNKTAPLSVMVVDNSLKSKKQYAIKLTNDKFLFHSLKLTVKPPFFYVWDGTAALVFQGNISDWKANLWSENTVYFNAFEPIGVNKAAFRAISSENRENVLGILSIKEDPKVLLKPLLDKQIDGIFDTNGSLKYNEANQKLIYTYTFKNEYLITDELLSSKAIFNTIDTISKVRIKVRYLSSKKQSKLASPEYIVNARTSTFGNYLFVNSLIMGKHEVKEMWDEASIIDVYNIVSNTYEFSFYLTNIKNNKMTDFVINRDRVFVITGQFLSTYKLKENFYSKQKIDYRDSLR